MHWRWPKTPSLALRLAWVFALAIAVIAGLYLAVQAVLAQRFAHYITQQSLMGQTHDIAEAITVRPDGSLSVRLQEQDGQNFDAFFANLKYRVLARDGRVLASSDATLDSLMPGVSPPQQDGHYLRIEIDRTPFHVATVHHRIQGQDYWIQVGRSDRFAALAQEAIVPAITEAVAITAAIAMVVLALLSYWGVRSVLLPIRQASQAARAIEPHNLSARLPVQPLPTEIRPLVQAFNEVLERLELSFEAQQRFFANAAHELKTPIALLRGQLERHPGPLPADTLRDIDALGRTVNQLLHVAEVSGGRPLNLQAQDAEAMARQVVGFLSWRAERADVGLHLLPPATPVEVLADAGELFVLLKNLVENAIDHTPQGGIVRITLLPSTLRVEDQGPGVPEADRTRVFERFWRSPGNRHPGSGLGLAIALDIARAHGWQLVCGESALGGALFELRFGPISPQYPEAA
jgi:signal transduction histidine kinase